MVVLNSRVSFVGKLFIVALFIDFETLVGPEVEYEVLSIEKGIDTVLVGLEFGLGVNEAFDFSELGIVEDASSDDCVTFVVMRVTDALGSTVNAVYDKVVTVVGCPAVLDEV